MIEGLLLISNFDDGQRLQLAAVYWCDHLASAMHAAF